MGDEVDSQGETADVAEDVGDLTAEQVVAADTAMRLDLGESEVLAEGIAAQSGGGDTVVDRRPKPQTDETPPEP